MLSRNCPQCKHPVSVFSKGVVVGKFNCPQCNEALASRPAIIGMGLAAAGGVVLGMAAGLSLMVTMPVAIVLSYPFVIRLVRQQGEKA